MGDTKLEKKLSLSSVFDASRWLLLPLYVGLLLVLLVLSYRFAFELIRLVGSLPDVKNISFLASVLSLVEFTLVGHLVFQVALSGYRSFVARTPTSRTEQAGLSASEMKMRVIASVIAIATVELLKSAIEIESATEKELTWSLIIYGAFLVGGLASAAIDALSHAPGKRRDTAE